MRYFQFVGKCGNVRYVTYAERLAERIRIAREGLPLTEGEQRDRQARYKLKRYLAGPLTQPEFARRLGVTETTVKRWEKTGIVGEANQRELADMTGISVADLQAARPTLPGLQAEVEELWAAVDRIRPGLRRQPPERVRK